MFYAKSYGSNSLKRFWYKIRHHFTEDFWNMYIIINIFFFIIETL